MIDVANEKLIGIEDVAAQSRRHFSSVFRWIFKGVPGPDGQRVRLEAIRLGGRWGTSPAALQRFAEATTPKLNGDDQPAPRSPTARQRASERAAAVLEAQGL